MNKNYLIIFLSIISITVFSQKNKIICGKSKEDANIILEIKLPNELYLNSDINLLVTIKNNSKYLVYETEAKKQNSNFPFILKLENNLGEKIELTPFGKEFFTIEEKFSKRVLRILPGGEKTFKINLIDIFNIKATGNYYLNISKSFNAKKIIKGKEILPSWDDSKPLINKNAILMDKTMKGANLYKNDAIISVSKIPIIIKKEESEKMIKEKTE